MALSQLYNAIAGDTITAARWNNEFGNIYTNGTDVAFPVTKAVSFAGFTITLDAAGISTIISPSNTGFVFTVGTKAGTPSVNGGLGVFTASTFTDTNTASSGTAAIWTGLSVRTPTLAASNTLVTTTDASTFHVEAGPTAGTNQTLTNTWAISTGGDVKVGGDLVVRKTDSARTNTVDTPLIVESVTTGTPDVGIGTGMLFRAESQDENPSDIGQLDFTFSDRTTASEDSYFQILLRIAGAALAAAYRWVATTSFTAIFTHANTADRTYTLPNESTTLVGTTDTATLTNKTFGGPAPASPVANMLYSDNLVKGWCHLTGAGAFTLTDDFNVSSITDNSGSAPGDFTINWATAFANATYAVVGIIRGSAFAQALVVIESTDTAKTASAVRLYTMTTGAGDTRADPNAGVCVIAIGD